MTQQENASNYDVSEFIAFRIGAEEYCVDIMTVREIRGWTQATALPHAPDYVCGLINLRGTVLPILDLAARLGLPATEPSSRHVNIVLQLENQIVGLLVDAVSDILTVGNAEMHATPEVASETAKLFVKGVLAIEDRMIRLVDAEQIFPNDIKEAA